MLTHANVGSNVEAVGADHQYPSAGRTAGLPPFFHAFGSSITMWTVATNRAKGVYHYDPLDAKTVGRLARTGSDRLGGDTDLAPRVPAALRSRRFPAVVVTGAERLPKDLCDAFEAKFGVRPVEGYGATELSPLVAANIPPNRTPPATQPESRKEPWADPFPEWRRKSSTWKRAGSWGRANPACCL